MWGLKQQNLIMWGLKQQHLTLHYVETETVALF